MDSQGTPSGLPPDFHQTSTRLPANSKQVSIWRAHLESFFGKPILRVHSKNCLGIAFYGEIRVPTYSQQTPNKLLIGSQQTQPGCNLVTLFGELFWRDHLMNSQQTPSGIPADSKWIPSGLPANSNQTLSGLPADSQRTPSRLPADSRQTSTRSQFGELIWRAHMKSYVGELF